MNCKLCGYYYSSHEDGNACQHCGGNREGLQNTRLMTVSKILVVTALVILAFMFMCTEIIRENIRDMYEQQYYSDDGSGTHWERLIDLSCLMSFLFSFPVIFRKRKCNFLHFIVSAISLFPAMFILYGETIPFLMTAVPCLLLIISAVTALIDKKKQVQEYKFKRC